MTMTNDSPRYPSADYTNGPTFTGLDFVAGIVGAAMLLLPLTAAGTHYSHVGWDTAQAIPQK